MAGRQRVGAKAERAIEQRRELQIGCCSARTGSACARMLYSRTKFDTTVLVEAVLEIEDVVRDADCRGDAPRVVQVVEGAARAECRPPVDRPSPSL